MQGYEGALEGSCFLPSTHRYHHHPCEGWLWIRADFETSTAIVNKPYNASSFLYLRSKLNCILEPQPEKFHWRILIFARKMNFSNIATILLNAVVPVLFAAFACADCTPLLELAKEQLCARLLPLLVMYICDIRGWPHITSFSAIYWLPYTFCTVLRS